MAGEETTDLVPLLFTVVHCTSGDGTVLHKYDEEGDGWQSEKKPSGEQRLVLKISHSDPQRLVHALEIICHESKTPEKIEISLGSNGGEGDDDDGDAALMFDKCTDVTHLGYITISDPKASSFQSRELKSIPINLPADFIQLTLQKCHPSRHNIHNQVAIVGVRVLGVCTPPLDDAEEGAPNEFVKEFVCAEAEAGPPVESRTLNVPVKEVASAKTADSIDIKPISSLPSRVKKELDVKSQSCVDRLERLKKERASREDFDTAAAIKQSLGNVYALLVSYKDCESNMRVAAAEEDYALASKLKSERDLKKDAAMIALRECEEKFMGKLENAVGDLSISTIKDESVCVSPARSSRSFAGNPHDEKKIVTSFTSHPENSVGESESISQSSHDEASSNEHPLEGVDNADELPTPEEITDVSPDVVHKVEALFGGYRTQCFFSKNWVLREAALAKMTLLVQSVLEDADAAECAEALCMIVETGLDDKNVQVEMAALVLLDESLVHIEATDFHLALTPLLSRIVGNLLGKLSDSSKKVVESATLALVSLASSSAVDKAAIVGAATKKIRTRDSKGGRAVKARLQFLEHLVAEFGEDVACKRMVAFAKVQKAFEHKDGGVREASKSLIVVLMAIHGEEKIMELLQDGDHGVSERLSAEFRSRLAAVKRKWSAD